MVPFPVKLTLAEIEPDDNAVVPLLVIAELVGPEWVDPALVPFEAALEEVVVFVLPA